MTCPAIITFDYTSFVTNPEFVQFSNSTKYPEATLQLWWNNAINYISDVGNFGSLQDGQREYAIQLMLAHLLFLQALILKGQTPYVLQNATIDKITVGLVPPPVKTQFQWWLSASPFGQQLLALLQGCSAGGYYIGGVPALPGFSGFSGVWGDPWSI